MAHATSITNTVTRRLARRVAFPSLAAVALSLAGCATDDAAPRGLRPGDGIAEYRQIVEEALGAMGAALHSLDRVSAQTNRCPPQVLARGSGVWGQELNRVSGRLRVGWL